MSVPYKRTIKFIDEFSQTANIVYVGCDNDTAECKEFQERTEDIQEEIDRKTLDRSSANALNMNGQNVKQVVKDTEMGKAQQVQDFLTR